MTYTSNFDLLQQLNSRDISNELGASEAAQAVVYLGQQEKNDETRFREKVGVYASFGTLLFGPGVLGMLYGSVLMDSPTSWDTGKNVLLASTGMLATGVLSLIPLEYTPANTRIVQKFDTIPKTLSEKEVYYTLAGRPASSKN